MGCIWMENRQETIQMSGGKPGKHALGNVFGQNQKKGGQKLRFRIWTRATLQGPSGYGTSKEARAHRIAAWPCGAAREKRKKTFPECGLASQ